MPEVEEETEMDPAAAAGAAKGLITTANSVTKSSLFQALFLPTAKAYGDHWGAETREKLQQAKAAKKRSNVASHLQAVQPRISVDFKPDPELTEVWMSGAEEIDPVDEELSRAWRATLLAIGEANPYRKRMLEAVKGMSAEEARAFAAISAGARRETTASYVYGFGGQYPASITECRGRLESLGLVRSRWDMLLSPYTRWAVVLAGSMVGTGLLLRPMAALVGNDSIYYRTFFDVSMPLMLGLALLLCLLTLARMMTSVSLTTFGGVLASAIARLGVTQPGEVHATEHVTEPAASGFPGPVPMKRKRTIRKASAPGEREELPASAA